MQRERASKKQQELLGFVDSFIKDNGYSPSYREIMNALGYKSVSTVATHIDGLITKGYVVRRDNSARSLEVVTTRMESITPTVEKDVDIEKVLIEKISTSEFTENEQAVVKQALSLLGYTKAVDAMTKEEENAQTANS